MSLTSLTTKSGRAVFPIGIGTWAIASRINPANLGSRYRGVEAVKGNEDREIEALQYSLSRGQNHVDCAEMYGGFYTDEVVGRAMAGANRGDLYVADKLWKSSVGRGLVRPTVEKMLAKLETDYLDMLYIHAPWTDAPWREAIPQIDQLIDEGMVRQFGVSNFQIAQMEQAQVLAKHPISANQMHFNLLHRDEADDKFRNYCRHHEIEVIAYRPIERQAVISNSQVQAVAAKHRATPAQVALAWLLQLGALPITKATTIAHIDENLGALKLRLSEADMLALSRGGRGKISSKRSQYLCV
jgi:diketogulonate reductase-like aldo/keto reductase